MRYTRLEIICSMIFLSLILNIFSINRIFHCSSILSSNEVQQPSAIISKTKESSPISTIERSKKALEKLKSLLNSVKSANDQPWIWCPTEKYPSVPYQPTPLVNQKIPRTIHDNISIVPQSVKDEIHRVCQRLIKVNKIAGKIWCKLFKKCYADTLATTTTLLDDNSTYIITGDIDLMWLRDSR